MPANEANNDFYYNHSGEKVFLQRDPGRYAVRYRRGKSLRNSELSEKAAKFVRQESQPVTFFSHHNLHVYETVSPEPQGVTRSVATLNDEPDVVFATPAFRRSEHPDDQVFLLNRFIVEFEPGVSENDALQFLKGLNARSGARIVERLAYTQPNVAYLLETPAGDGEFGPIETAKRYYEAGNTGELKLVRYSQPDLVQKRNWRGTLVAQAVPSSAPAASDDWVN